MSEDKKARGEAVMERLFGSPPPVLPFPERFG